MKSTPCKAMEVEGCLMPLHIRRQLLCDRYLSKCLSDVSHPIRRRLDRLQLSCQRSTYWENKGLPLLLQSFQNMISDNIIKCFPGPNCYQLLDYEDSLNTVQLHFINITK